jgi:hypothetical protein
MLLLGAGAPFFLWSVQPRLAIIVPFVVGHFFLFCNVVRLRRSCELIWAGVFCACALVWLLAGWMPTWVALGTPGLVTVCVVLLEISSPRYHGIFSRPPDDEGAL